MIIKETRAIDLGGTLTIEGIDIQGKLNVLNVQNYGQELTIKLNNDIVLFTKDKKLFVTYIVYRPNHDHDDSTTKEVCELKTVVEY